MAEWGWTSSKSTRSSSEAEPERHRLKTPSDIECGLRPTLPLVYSYNFKVDLSIVILSSHNIRKCLIALCLSLAFLFEGTAEIALQDLTNLSEYTERKSKWESGVKFSVVQVKIVSISKQKA